MYPSSLMNTLSLDVKKGMVDFFGNKFHVT